MTDSEILIREASEDAPTPQLAAAFPKLIVDCERAVYEYVRDAVDAGALTFYPDRAQSEASGLKIPVVAGWPAYPGEVPAIGVAAGTETEDEQSEVIQGGFIGDAASYVPDPETGEPTGQLLGTAAYYAEQLYSPITVELIHENRDERDRLHNQLRALLLPIRRTLLERVGQIKRVRVDAEKTEATNGPMGEETPMVVYLSLFTVHIYSEMLVPAEITGPEGLVSAIGVEVVEPQS